MGNKELTQLRADVADLLIQATTERSHYYVASVLRRVAAALEAAEAETPVAWRVKDFADGWILCTALDDAERMAHDYGAAMEPLYTHPSPLPPSVLEEVKDVLREISRDVTGKTIEAVDAIRAARALLEKLGSRK